MLTGAVKAAILLNTEPAFDAAAGAKGLEQADMVITLSPFKANLDISDVLLPVAPFTETSGTFVNAEGRVQSFHAVVKPLGIPVQLGKYCACWPICWSCQALITNRRKTC